MALQTSVVTAAPVAVPGMAATPDQSVYTPLNYLADDTNGVHVGRFVWFDSDGNLSNTQVASTLPVGLVERVIIDDRIVPIEHCNIEIKESF